MVPLRFTKQESLNAQKAWGANCGPHALAAACEVDLKTVEKAVAPFKGWMSPSQMEGALNRLGRHFQKNGNLFTKEPKAGILRVQWHGPWLKNPNPAASYKHTHWVACRQGHIHDTVIDGAWGQWMPIKDWIPKMESYSKREYAGWHFTHWFRLQKTEANLGA